MRLFLGIPLPAEITGELASASTRLRTRNEGLRWSTSESWHITLQFLGNTSQEQYSCLVARLRDLRLRTVSLQLGSLNVFDRAGVLCAEIQLTPELAALQQAITDATAVCGFTPEAREYHPHITLARAKGKAGKSALQRLETEFRRPKFSSFLAGAFLLYESVLGPAGSRYIVRERFILR